MKTILVLEDEPVVMRLFSRVLIEYIILEAVTAAEALRLFCDSDHHVDLLITVLTLAKGSGTQVALQLRLTVPTLPVILASCCGPTYWTDQESAALRKLGTASVKILEKPFFPSILLRKVHELIGAPNEVIASAGAASAT